MLETAWCGDVGLVAVDACECSAVSGWRDFELVDEPDYVSE